MSLIQICVLINHINLYTHTHSLKAPMISRCDTHRTSTLGKHRSSFPGTTSETQPLSVCLSISCSLSFRRQSFHECPSLIGTQQVQLHQCMCDKSNQCCVYNVTHRDQLQLHIERETGEGGVRDTAKSFEDRSKENQLQHGTITLTHTTDFTVGKSQCPGKSTQMIFMLFVGWFMSLCCQYKSITIWIWIS